MHARDWPAWICPKHGELLAAEGEDLVCVQGERFPIRSGIARFVEGSNYADHFGEQWNRFRSTQLDSKTGVPISRERLHRCLGAVLSGQVVGKQVLECGCGAGRFTEVLLADGALVTSIDLSSAVDANADSFPPGPAHRIAQADIRRLPFAKQSFDVVMCLGVIQHTPDPEATIAALYEQVAPGGTLVIDHYALSVGWFTRTAPLFRQVLKRMPEDQAFQVTDKLVEIFLPLHKKAQHVPVVRSLLARVSPILHYYAVYPELSDEMQREWARLDTHDTLTDHFKHFRSRKQISQVLSNLGMKNIWCEPGGNGVEARGQRPAQT